MTSPLACKCGQLLSPDGLGYVRQGYRVSRRSVDGTPILGLVVRPAKGALCRPCAVEAVASRKAGQRARRVR